MARIKVVKEKGSKQEKPRKERQKNKQKFKMAFSVIAIFVIAAGVLFWALQGLPQKPPTQAKAQYKGVIELWNVESFEGGSGSRQSWLTNKSAKFEKSNSGLFVHVTTLTGEEAAQKINDGQTFDIICFSRGVGDTVKENLAPLELSAKDVRENLLIAGQIDGKQYAMPLYTGAYCLFARTSQLNAAELLSKALTQTCSRKIGKNTVELQPLICGFTAYNSPLTALAMSGGRGDASKLDEKVSQYSAYEQFVSNKTAVTLLGTQRDLYRLSQRETNGKIEQLGFCALNGYTDLTQFVGVSRNCGEKMQSCLAYIEYLLSKEVQQSLTDLSLFSVLSGSIYTDERYASCEQALDSAFVPNVFVGAEVIANQRQTAIATLAI